MRYKQIRLMANIVLYGNCLNSRSKQYCAYHQKVNLFTSQCKFHEININDNKATISFSVCKVH